MTHALDELADLSADLMAWLEWEKCLGAVSWPRERVEPRERVDRPVQHSKAAPSPPRSAPGRPHKAAAQRPPAPKAAQPTVQTPRSGPPAAPAAIPSRWEAYASPAPLAQGSGPVGAPLALIWTEGASPEASAMLERMLQGVLHLERDDICVISLSRVRAKASRFHADLLKEVERLQPGLLLVMGTLGTRAILGESAEAGSARQDWHTLEGKDRLWAARVTHHPEHIRLEQESGNPVPRREAFEDLQAVATRLSPA